MERNLILIIIGMTAATYLPRMLPVTILTRYETPKIVVRWLSYVPVAVLSALLLPGILIHEGNIDFGLTNRYLLASIPCFFVSYCYRNMFLTIIIGMAAIVLLRLLV